MKKLTIIVPVYNTGKKIKKTLNSIKNQTFKDFECLLMNDGGKDMQTIKIINNFIKNDNRFQLHNRENNWGIERTRIDGINKARTNYIMFCDHDDYYEKNAFFVLYNVISKNDADIVVANYYSQFFRWLKKRKKNNYINNITILKKEEFIKEYYINFFGYRKFGVSTWGMIYKKAVFDKKNIKTLGHNFMEDVIFNLQIFENANKIIFIPDFLYTHIHGGLTSKFEANSVLDGYDEAYGFRLDFLKNNSLESSVKFLDWELKNVIISILNKSIEYKYSYNEFKQLIKKIKHSKSYNIIRKKQLLDDNLILIEKNNAKELYFKLKKLNSSPKKNFKKILRKLYTKFL